METPRKDDCRDDREIPSQENDTTDEALFRRYQQNHDAAAFRTIVERYTPELETFLRRRLKALAANTRDVLQDVFTDLLTSEEPLEEDALLRPFLFKVAKFRLIKHVQAAKAKKRDYRRTTNPDSQLGGDSRANGLSCIADPKANPDILDAKIEVEERMAKLPPTEEVAVRMVDLQGHSMPSAAKMLKLPPTTVEWRVRSGRERLKGMAGASVILIALVGAVADNFGLDDFCMNPVSVEVADDDEVVREDDGHHDSDKQHRRSLARLRGWPEVSPMGWLAAGAERPIICKPQEEQQQASSVFPPLERFLSRLDHEEDGAIVPFGAAQETRSPSKAPGVGIFQAA